MSSISKRWLVFGSIALVGVVGVCTMGILSFQDSDPVPYIRDHYQRTASLDQTTGDAYTSPQPRTTVVSNLRDETNEHDHRTADNIDFLQYDDHIVAISDRGTGSMIYVDDYRDGYRRYAGTYSAFAFFGWSSSPPGGGGFRGGGGGFGK